MLGVIRNRQLAAAWREYFDAIRDGDLVLARRIREATPDINNAFDTPAKQEVVEKVLEEATADNAAMAVDSDEGGEG